MSRINLLINNRIWAESDNSSLIDGSKIQRNLRNLVREIKVLVSFRFRSKKHLILNQYNYSLNRSRSKSFGSCFMQIFFYFQPSTQYNKYFTVSWVCRFHLYKLVLYLLQNFSFFGRKNFWCFLRIINRQHVNSMLLWADKHFLDVKVLEIYFLTWPWLNIMLWMFLKILERE